MGWELAAVVSWGTHRPRPFYQDEPRRHREGLGEGRTGQAGACDPPAVAPLTRGPGRGQLLPHFPDTLFALSKREKKTHILRNQVLFNPLTYSFPLACHIHSSLSETSITPHLPAFSPHDAHTESTPPLSLAPLPSFISPISDFYAISCLRIISRMGWAVGCFPSEGNSIFKMGLWGCIKLYTG